MDKELQDKLYKDFPEIFKQKDLSVMESCMPWGCECGDGWEPLIRNLCSCIQSYIDSNKHLEISQLEVTQVKEKFGTLRFYYEGGDRLIGGMVWLAEYVSGKTCEECGKYGKRGIRYNWYSTKCDGCAKEGWKVVN